MDTCLFCRMVAGEIQPDKVYDDEHVLAFRDINPQAPVHILIVPKTHISSLDEAGEGDTELLGRLYQAARQVARQEGIADKGYRAVMNCNTDGGQTVFHLHVHLLGGRHMTWPPG